MLHHTIHMEWNRNSRRASIKRKFIRNFHTVFVCRPKLIKYLLGKLDRRVCHTTIRWQRGAFFLLCARALFLSDVQMKQLSICIHFPRGIPEHVKLMLFFFCLSQMFAKLLENGVAQIQLSKETNSRKFFAMCSQLFGIL